MTEEAPIQPDAVTFLQQLQTSAAEMSPADAIARTTEWLMANANAPMAFVVWYEFGRLLLAAHEPQRAEMAFRSALEQSPDLHMARLGLGQALEAQGRINDALTIWRAALVPDNVQVALFNSLGRVAQENFRLEDAERDLLQSLRINPDQPEVITTLLDLRQRLCHWPVIADNLGVAEADLMKHIGPLTALAEFNDPCRTLEASRSMLRKRGLLEPMPPLVEKGHRYPGHPRVRIGFLSADFQLHATSIFFAPILERLDRHRFEVYAFDLTTIKNTFFNMRERLLGAVDHHEPLQALDDLGAAQRIRACEIDILIDMAGMTSGARPGILVHRPAPVQISYLGFIGSCGIPAVDYILTAEDMYQKSYAACFSEQALCLPGAYVTVDVDAPVGAAVSRESCGLPDNAVVFCALLNPYKIRPEVFASWMRILKAVPDSVLWLVEENTTSRRNLTAAAIAAGVDAKRLVFSPRIMPDAYRARLALADLFLDTSPYGNGATAHDAILAGLPMLTCPVNTMMSRFVAHLMLRIGLDELVVQDWGSYERLAIKLGSDREKLGTYRRAMFAARTQSPLFDPARFVKEFGDTLLTTLANVTG